jgi:hypothetical protein
MSASAPKHSGESKNERRPAGDRRAHASNGAKSLYLGVSIDTDVTVQPV